MLWGPRLVWVISISFAMASTTTTTTPIIIMPRIPLAPLPLIPEVLEGMTRPQLLILGPLKNDSSCFRNVASAGRVYATSVSGTVPIPRKHTEDYIVEPGAFETGEGGRGHSESDFANDWHGWTVFMDTLLNNSPVKQLLECAFGKDFVLLPERGCIRTTKAAKDLVCPLKRLTPHVDYPAWEQRPGTELSIYRVPCPVGKITVAIFDQADVHGVALGGNCVGWFLSAVTRAGYARYLCQLDTHITRLRKGSLSQMYHDPLTLPSTLSPEEQQRVDFVMGSRPRLYSSGKIVQAPHTMASRFFPHRAHRYLSPAAFKKIRNKPGSAINMEAVKKRLRERGLDDAFKNVYKVAPQWNVDPTAYSPYFLSRNYRGRRNVEPCNCILHYLCIRLYISSFATKVTCVVGKLPQRIVQRRNIKAPNTWLELREYCLGYLAIRPAVGLLNGNVRAIENCCVLYCDGWQLLFDGGQKVSTILAAIPYENFLIGENGLARPQTGGIAPR